MRQLGFVGQNLPGRIIKGHQLALARTQRRQPGLQILMKRLLRFHSLSNDNLGSIGEQSMQERDEEWLSATGNARDSTQASLLQPPDEVLHSGSFSGEPENARTWETLCKLRQSVR